MKMNRTQTLETSHGSIAVEEAGSGPIPVLLIHGNSSCRGIFRNQMNGRLATKHNFVAFDLPGHGDSGNAADPARTYTVAGYAQAAIEVLDQLGIKEAVVFGWSLGGHIGIEMLPRWLGLRGLMITGTPPVTIASAAEGFKPSPLMGLTGQQYFAEADIDAYARTSGPPFESFLRTAVARTDGLARKTMFEAFLAGDGIDQRQAVETSMMSLAVVNGNDDPFINLDYVDGLAYRNLWERRCHRLPGLGHAPFWQDPEMFDPLLERFLDGIVAAG